MAMHTYRAAATHAHAHDGPLVGYRRTSGVPSSHHTYTRCPSSRPPHTQMPPPLAVRWDWQVGHLHGELDRLVAVRLELEDQLQVQQAVHAVQLGVAVQFVVLAVGGVQQRVGRGGARGSQAATLHGLHGSLRSGSCALTLQRQCAPPLHFNTHGRKHACMRTPTAPLTLPNE